MPPPYWQPYGVRVSGTTGDDVLVGGNGQDTLEGGAGNDVYRGGVGEDVYLVDATDAGYDTLEVGRGDVIQVSNMGPLSQWRVQFRTGADGSGRVAVIGSSALGDKMTLRLEPDFATAVLRDDAGNSILLTDLLQPLVQPIVGTSGTDWLGGSSLSEVLNGLDGNDRLYGFEGSDTLDGGVGDDTLFSGIGQGNDVLRTRLSDAGQDLLMVESVCTIDIQDDISLKDLTFSYVPDTKTGVDDGFKYLVDIGVVARNGQPAQDQEVLVDLMPLAVNHDVNTFDVTVRTGRGEEASLKSLLANAKIVQSGTTGADTFQGTFANDVYDGLAGNDLIYGGSGTDSLSGGLGNDTIEGGKGNDTLVGGKGNDTYNFARGDGRDLLIDKDSTWGNKDALVFSDARSDQLWLTRVGSDLNVAIIGTQDQVTIQGWFSSTANRVEGIYAGSDSKMLSAAKVSALVSVMSGFTNQAMGSTDLGAGVPASVTKLISTSWTTA